MTHKLESDCWEKYQQPQICRWHNSNGRKWKGIKESFHEGEGEEWKAGLKLNIQKTKIMAYVYITSWQIEGEKWKPWQILFSWALKITGNSDYSCEIKRCLLFGGKAMTNLDSVLKIRDITLLTKVHIVKTTFFPVVMYGCESWSIKKVEHWRTDAFELWCWGRLLGMPWTARKSNWSFLKEINPKYSLQGLLLKLKLQYFGHRMWSPDSLEKTLMLGKIEGKRRSG